MVRILLLNHWCCLNKGAASILISVSRILKRVSPSAEFTVLSSYPKIDSTRCNAIVLERCVSPSVNKLNAILSMIRCAFWALLFRALKVNLDPLIEARKRKTLEAYTEADIVLSVGADVLAETYGFGPFVGELYEIFLAILLKKPVIIYAQTIGPLGKIGALLLKFVLNNVNLITVRGKISSEFLRKIGVNKTPIYLTPDPAFILQPVSEEKVQEIMSRENISKRTGPLVGITVSHTIYRRLSDFRNNEEKFAEYVKLMSQTVDYLTEKLDANVVFLPYFVGLGIESEDDISIATRIYHRAKNRDKIRLVVNEYTPEELKALTGQLDLLIGARIHSIIHATSMLVPTIGLDPTHKVREVMRMLGQNEHVCDIESLDLDELMSKIDMVYSDKDEINKELAPKVKNAQERVLLTSKLIKDLLASSHRGSSRCA